MDSTLDREIPQGTPPLGGDSAAPARTGVDLYWLPLGAGGHSVRLNGRLYEAVAAWLGRRPACESLAGVLPARAGATRRGARRRPGHVNHGLNAPMSAVDLRPTAHGGQSTRFHSTWCPEGA